MEPVLHINDPDCGFYTGNRNRKDSNTRKFRPEPNRTRKIDPYPESGNPYPRSKQKRPAPGTTRICRQNKMNKGAATLYLASAPWDIQFKPDYFQPGKLILYQFLFLFCSLYWRFQYLITTSPQGPFAIRDSHNHTNGELCAAQHRLENIKVFNFFKSY